MIVLEEILPYAGANILEKPAQPTDDRIVAAYRMERLPQIVEPDTGQCGAGDKQRQGPRRRKARDRQERRGYARRERGETNEAQ